MIYSRFKPVPNKHALFTSKNTVKLLFICLVLNHCTFSFSSEDHDSDLNNSKKEKKQRGVNFPDSKSGNGSEEDTESCKADPLDISAFANGDSYNFKGMIQFIASPSCNNSQRSIANIAMKQNGVNFQSPLMNLEVYSKELNSMNFEDRKKLDQKMIEQLDRLERNGDLTGKEVLPLLGKLSLLSPEAARTLITYQIKKELIATSLLLDKKVAEQDALTKEVSETLLLYGASENKIASKMAEVTEAMAINAEADSLARMLKALALAANLENKLVPTFNISIGALNRGMQRGAEFFDLEQKNQFLKTLFSITKVTANGNLAFDPALDELNDAFGKLMSSNFENTTLRKTWKEVVRLLSKTKSQGYLADALAFSLTDKMFYLPKEDIFLLLKSAENYPVLAHVFQKKFLSAFTKLREKLAEGTLSVVKFNEIKASNFEAYVSHVLDFDQKMINSEWLVEVVRRDLIKDSDVEKRFPKLMLSVLHSWEEKQSEWLTNESSEKRLSGLFKDFSTLWNLSTVHVPTLQKWIKKYEAE